MHPPPARPVRRLHLRDRPAGGAFRTRIPQRGQLVVHHIRADPTTQVLDPFLQLRQERIDEHRPPLATSRCQPALLPRRNIIRDRVMRTPGQHRASRHEPVKSKASKISMISSADFTHPSSGQR